MITRLSDARGDDGARLSATARSRLPRAATPALACLVLLLVGAAICWRGGGCGAAAAAAAASPFSVLLLLRASASPTAQPCATPSPSRSPSASLTATPTPAPTPSASASATPSLTPPALASLTQAPSAFAPASLETAQLAWRELSALDAASAAEPAATAAALCARLRAQRISALVLLGDSFAINALLDVRSGVFGERTAPSRRECWAQRRGGLTGPECSSGVVCDGEVEVRHVQTQTHELGWPSLDEMNAALDGLLEKALPTEFAIRRTAVISWYFLWFLYGDITRMETALPRIALEVPPLLARIRARLPNPEHVALVGSTWPGCQVPIKAVYCPKQGPDNMRIVNQALRDVAIAGSWRFVDVFELSHAAGDSNFEGDGTHPGAVLNRVVIDLALRSIGI